MKRQVGLSKLGLVHKAEGCCQVGFRCVWKIGLGLLHPVGLGEGEGRLRLLWAPNYMGPIRTLGYFGLWHPRMGCLGYLGFAACLEEIVLPVSLFRRAPLAAEGRLLSGSWQTVMDFSRTLHSCNGDSVNGIYMCEHLPVSRVVMYSISLLVCFACMYKACRSATYRIKAP